MRGTRLTVLSVFSGAGGLDIGLEAVGFENKGCVEIDAIARTTLSLNRPNWPLLDPPDVIRLSKTLTPSDLGMDPGDLDLIAGGPPCQPFSKAAQWSPSGRNGLMDSRACGIGAFLNLVRTFRPRAILVENVPGFARGAPSALPYMASELEQINQDLGTRYRIDHRVLDASEFGVPQIRKRVFLIAFRDGMKVRWPRPTHKDRPVRAWDALRDTKSDDPPRCGGSWTGLLPSIPEGQNYLFHTSEGGGEPLFGYRRRYWSFLLKLAKARPSWTIPAQPGPSSGPFHWDNRPLSPLEMQRLQTFPSTWRFAGGYRDQVRQIGNATPPLLAEIVGRMISDSLGHRSRGPFSLAIRRSPRVPRANRRTAVPAQYLELRGKHPPHPGSGKGPAPRPSSPMPRGPIYDGATFTGIAISQNRSKRDLTSRTTLPLNTTPNSKL